MAKNYRGTPSGSDLDVKENKVVSFWPYLAKKLEGADPKEKSRINIKLNGHSIVDSRSAIVKALKDPEAAYAVRKRAVETLAVHFNLDPDVQGHLEDVLNDWEQDFELKKTIFEHLRQRMPRDQFKVLLEIWLLDDDTIMSDDLRDEIRKKYKNI